MDLSGSSDLAGRRFTSTVGKRNFGKGKNPGKRLAREGDADNTLVSVNSVTWAVFVHHMVPWVGRSTGKE